MTVLTKNAVLVVESAQHGAMEQDTSAGQRRRRSPTEYRELWQQIHDEALARGASPDGARFVANERLVRIQAEDVGTEPPGVGNHLSY